MEEAITPSKRRRETSRAGDEEGVSLTNNVREELERITKKYEDLVKKLRDKVECPVCFDVPRKPPVPVSFFVQILTPIYLYYFVTLAHPPFTTFSCSLF